MLNSKERILYILSLVFLASILGYILFAGDEDYVQDYNSQINDLESKIDSLHGINSTLNIKIEGLNDQISTLDKELDLQDTKIIGLKKKVNEKIISIDWNCFSQTVTKDSSIQLEKTVAKFIIKDLILGDGFKEELFLTDNKIQLLNQKIILKDSIILSLTSKNDNFETILSSKQNQLDLSQELSKKLQTDLKKQKAKKDPNLWKNKINLQFIKIKYDI